MMTPQRLALPFILFTSIGFAAPPKGTFPQSVYPVLEAAACRSCHQAGGVASTTRLQFPEEGASDDLLEKFGLSLVKLVDTKSPDKSFLLAKPTNRIAHAGGERIPQGSSEEKTLRKWVDYLATLSAEEVAAAHKADKELAEGGEPVRAVSLRRLTHAQYNNTVRDLLHEISAPANQFPPEDFINGFKNQYQAQSISPLLMEAYSAAAAKLARNAFRGGDARGLVGCKPSPACRSKFIREFGSKAFRRPLGAAEIATYEKLFQYEKEFLPGAQLVMEAMLQSPYFLFRIDDTEDPKLRPYATASRLSYAIWDTMPDETLLAKAAAGKLDTPEGIEAEVRRLFASPRARPALDEFVSQWMRFDRLMTASKNRRAFPWFNRETAVAMTGEAKHFVADLVWSDRNFMELFTSPNGYVNGDLANVYKVPAPAKEFSPVPFPADSERAGILGQALFLALTAKPEETSPTARGLFVREQFLCQHVADPPPGVNTNLPEVSEARPQTNRERLKEHTVNQSCAGCHSLIDPIGFGLEKFDAAGMRRENLKLTFSKGVNGGAQTVTSTAELPLDTTGFVAGVKSSDFSSPKELGAVLARTPACQQCIVKQYFRWTAGRMETPADRPLIQDVADKFEKSGFRFKEMAVTLIMARERQFQQGATHVAINHKTR